MNNSAMWKRELAGAETATDTNSYDRTIFFPTSGLSDLSEYKSFRFDINQRNLNLHLRNGALLLTGKFTQKTGDAAITKDDKCSPSHNMLLHLFSNVKMSVNGEVIEE